MNLFPGVGFCACECPRAAVTTFSVELGFLKGG